MKTWFLFRNLSWPFIQLGMLVFCIMAARRHRLRGLWVLAAATILSIMSSVVQLVISQDVLMQHPGAFYFLMLSGIGYYAAMVAALVGWGLLALSRETAGRSSA